LVQKYTIIEAALAVVGAGIAGTLWVAHRNGVNLPCSRGGGCEAVAASPWAQVTIGPWHDVSTALVGLFGYVLLLTLAMLKLGSENAANRRRLHRLLWAIAAMGAAYSIYLQWVAHFKISGAPFCIYCFASACVMVALFVTATLEVRTLKR